MNFRALNPSLNCGGKANWYVLEPVSKTVENITNTYTLDELVAGAREHEEMESTLKAENETLKARQAELREEIGRLEKRRNEITRDLGECSYGKLLPRAIGEKRIKQPN